jgi:hypothetical protein
MTGASIPLCYTVPQSPNGRDKKVARTVARKCLINIFVAMFYYLIIYDMDTVNNTQMTTKQLSKQDVIKQIRATMQKVDPTARVILHQDGKHWVSEDLDKIIDLVVVVDKDQLSLDEDRSITKPLWDIEDNIDYQFVIYPHVVPKSLWIRNNMPTQFCNTVMNHENGTVLC